MPQRLPRLSRFELQCLRALWSLREGSVRAIHERVPGAPSYSTVRKIVERLEEKKAVARLRLEGKAWVYRPAVGATEMLRREIRMFLDSLFDGAAGPLVSHLAEMNELSVEDLREAERQIAPPVPGRRDARGRGKKR